MPITLKRDLTGVDWDALSFVYSQTLGHDAPDQLERTWTRTYATVLAYEGDKMVGAARALSDGEREALIVGVAVLPEYQRQGIGSAMMRNLIEQVNGCAIVLTSSEDENTPFYRRLGFRTHKRTMVLHYPDDVVID
ncbi:MAG: GNAT family N-acetyltransferase [Dehalococcoidia bacterium]